MSNTIGKEVKYITEDTKNTYEYIIKELREKKAGVKSLSFDTAGNYLVQYSNGDLGTFDRKAIENDLDEGINKIIYANKNGEVNANESVSQPDISNDEDVSGDDDSELAEGDK